MVQNHVHFQLASDGAEVNQYHVKFDGSWDNTPVIPLVVDRALDTTLHYATVLTDSGVPKVLANQKMTLSFMTTAEKDKLLTLIARPISFIPIDHSDDGNTNGHLADRKPVILALRPGSVVAMDAACTYWCAGIEVIAND